MKANKTKEEGFPELGGNLTKNNLQANTPPLEISQ